MTDTSAVGTIEVKSINNGVAKELFFKYKGPTTPLRSDLIPVKNIKYVKAVSAADMAEKLKQVKVSLNPAINGGVPVVGQDYIIRITFRQFYGMSDNDIYLKYGAVHVVAGDTAEKFYQKMAESLKKNFARELGTYLTFEAKADGLYIKEVEQPYIRGIESRERVYFEVNPGTIYVDGDETDWGITQVSGEIKDSLGNTVTPLTEAGTIKNGPKIAEMEYFCLGERGDQYRNIGWPDVIPTVYQVDPGKEYNTLEIHYTFTDTGTSSYDSDKDITIVAEDAAVINNIVDAINTAAGLTVEKLAVAGGAAEGGDTGGKKTGK